MENSINKDFLLTNALNSATALKGLLEQEFEALKSQNIADFEKTPTQENRNYQSPFKSRALKHSEK